MAKIKTIKDGTNKIYPVTTGDAVYVSSTETLSQALAPLNGGGGQISDSLTQVLAERKIKTKEQWFPNVTWDSKNKWIDPSRLSNWSSSSIHIYLDYDTDDYTPTIDDDYDTIYYSYLPLGNIASKFYVPIFWRGVAIGDFMSEPGLNEGDAQIIEDFQVNGLGGTIYWLKDKNGNDPYYYLCYRKQDNGLVTDTQKIGNVYTGFDNVGPTPYYVIPAG